MPKSSQDIPDISKHLDETRTMFFRLQSKEAIYDAMSDADRHDIAKLRRDSFALQRYLETQSSSTNEDRLRQVAGD